MPDPQSADPLQRELACKDGAPDAQLLGDGEARIVVHPHLGGSVDPEPGKVAAHKVADPEILDNHPVDMERFEPGQSLPEPGHLRFPDDGVEGDVNPSAPVRGELPDSAKL